MPRTRTPQFLSIGIVLATCQCRGFDFIQISPAKLTRLLDCRGLRGGRVPRR